MLPVLACNSPPGWVPCLCQTLDINNLWPSQQAVLIGPPCFLMRKLRGGPHTTVQWGCWSSKPEQANCRSLSLPTTLLWLSQHFLGFEFYFQTETLNMRPVPPAFTPDAIENSQMSQWYSGLMRWSQTLWLSHHALNVPRLPNSPWLSFPGKPLWLGTPFLLSALSQALVPKVTQLLSSKAGSKPGLCE